MAVFHGFAKELNDFEAFAMDKVDTATRMIAMEFFRRVILKTPVDTGRARANWICTIAVPAEAMTGGDDWFQGSAEAGITFDRGASAVQAAVDEVMGWKPADAIIFLTNNLPYIVRLEDGYSGQAPAGMVVVTLAELGGIIVRIA